MNHIKQFFLCSVLATAILNQGYCDDLTIPQGAKLERLITWMMNHDTGYLFSKKEQNFFNINPIDWTEIDFETLRTALKNEITTNTRRYSPSFADVYLKSVDKGIDEMKKQQSKVLQQLAESRHQREIYNEKIKQKQAEEQQQLAESRHQQELANQKKEQKQVEEQQRLELALQNVNLIYKEQKRKAQHNNLILLVAIALSFVISIVVYYALHRRKIKKLKFRIEFLAVLKNGSQLTEEKKALDKEAKLQNSEWEKFKPQIVNHLIAEYKPIITGDARAIILESVALRLEDGVRDFQSFLPPSIRLPASHYAPFLITEDDVERFKTEQKNIASWLLLKEEFVPYYENETIVWVGNGE